MKIFFIKKRNATIYFLILIIVSISVLYSQGLAPKAFQAFIDQNRRIPIYSVETQEKKVAISFDAAWGDEFTQEILDILKRYDIKSTFFLVGFWIDNYPQQVEKIYQSGHEIGNHSTSHPDMAKISREEVIHELNVTGEKIEKITGEKPILFRPPFGSYNNTLIDTAEELGYYTIQWDVDSLDWKEEGIEPIIQRVKSKIQNGSIVLFHNNAKYMTKALPSLIEALYEDNYKIVAVSELIYKKDYYIDHTGKQVSK